jgi:hypothetical protein
VYRPRFFIAHDTELSAIVIAIQGTIHLSQVFTDLQAEYFPLGNGSAHLGMLRSAQWIVDHHLDDLKTWVKEKDVSKIYCTGHSLGAGTATILTLLIHDHLDMLRLYSEKPNLIVHGYGVASPPTVSKELADEHGDLFDHCKNITLEGFMYFELTSHPNRSAKC